MKSKVKFFNLFETFFIFNSSGCCGTAFDFFFEKNNSIIDLYVTKTVTYNKIPALNRKKCFILNNDLFFNRIGLINPGINDFLKELKVLNKKLPLKKIIVSLFFEKKEEVAKMLSLLEPLDFVVGYEINFSCPNTKNKLIEEETKLLKTILLEIKNYTKKLVFPKISIFSKKFHQNVKLISNLKFDAIVISNSAPSTIYLWEKNKVNAINGGLSGSFIKPLLLKKIQEIKKNFSIPIIACGGVKDYKDTLEYLIAGADYVQVGSYNFKNSKLIPNIINDIEIYFENNNFFSVADFLNKIKIENY